MKTTTKAQKLHSSQVEVRWRTWWTTRVLYWLIVLVNKNNNNKKHIKQITKHNILKFFMTH